jgi:hypothetical protein
MEGEDNCGKGSSKATALPSRRSARLESVRSSIAAVPQLSGKGVQRGKGGSEKGGEVPATSSSSLELKNDAAIVKAASAGDLVEVMKLHRQNVSLASIDGEGCTALMKAVEFGHWPVFQFLMRGGVALPEDQVKMSHAPAEGQNFWQQNYDNNYYFQWKNQGWNRPPFRMSSSPPLPPVPAPTFDIHCAGAGIDRQNIYGNTALHYAVGFDERGCLAELLLHGADDTIINNYERGTTAFIMAQECIGLSEQVRCYGGAWERMKARVTDSKIALALHCAITALTAPMVDKPTPLLHNLLRNLPESSGLMMQIMSLWTGRDPADGFEEGEEDPAFMDRRSQEYTSFASAVLRAFSTLPKSKREEGQSISFFMPFVNAGRAVPLSADRVRAMMTVLQSDGLDYGYGWNLAAEANPLRLNLWTLCYNRTHDFVRLADEDEHWERLQDQRH